MHAYDTVTQAVEGLKKRGFDLDFNLKEDSITCSDGSLNPDEFEIVEFYRFEGDSDPGDEAVVYAIQSKDGKKGILVNGYGISADAISVEMARKLSLQR